MNVKQWAVALLFGSLVLGAASCSKDDPNGPKSSVAIKYLEGSWDLGKPTISPETITIEGKEYKVADHIFKSALFTNLVFEPRFVYIKGKTAVLTTGGYCVNRKLTLALKEGKLSAHNLPFGSVVREGNQLHMEISIPNTLFKQMPSDLLTQGEGAFVLKAIADQGLDLKITATGTK